MEEIFAGLQAQYSKQPARRISYYFSIDDVKKTVVLDGVTCTVSTGKTEENADCVCKTSEEFFRKVWDERHQPGMSDFLSGRIKSNAPHLLQEFMKAFGR